MSRKPRLLELIIVAVAFATTGCASHTHIGDCFVCASYVRIQDQELDSGQTKAILTQTQSWDAAQTDVIYDSVGKAMGAERARNAAAHKTLATPASSEGAAVAPVKSTP